MQGKGTVNTFNQGMVSDVDILNQNSTSYRYSMNGRLMFNKDGTYSWETENGSKVSFTINARNGNDNSQYVGLGSTGNNNLVVLFSVREDEGASEIGLVSIDESGNGSYKTLFNDQDDPNGDKLNFKLHNQIEARYIFENPKCIRAYWVDGVKSDSNQPRTITFSYDETLGLPSDVSAYSGDNMSVHAINTQAEFIMGLIKYVKNIGGNILSGTYQYTYRLKTKSGYRTPWYPLSRKVFVTTDAVNIDNWNEYEMEGSGVESSKGNQLEVKGIDERFDDIEVAYLYMANPSTVADSKIFIQKSIDSDIMTFDHVSNVGEPLLVDEVAELFSGIVAAKTLNIKDATLYYGNIKENILSSPDVEEILKNLTMTPKFRDMRSEEKTLSNKARGNPPVGHGDLRTGITRIKQHSDIGGVEDYVIDNDYISYKGTQIDHLYPGYFRGETYRYAIVFYDKLGFKSFAYHLGDFNFPNQTENEYSWSRVTEDDTVVSFNGTLSERAWPTNNYNDPSLRSEKVFVGDNGNVSGSKATPNRQVSHLRIMGLEISGIDVSSIKDKISGFKIVRAKRDKTILLQGLIMPCVGITDGASFTFPLPTVDQRWYDDATGLSPVPTTNLSDIKLLGNYSTYKDTVDKFFIRPNESVMYCPAIDFGSTDFPSLYTQDQLILVGGCWDEGTLKGTWPHMQMNKYYYSKNTFLYGPAIGEGSYSSDPYPQYMSKAVVENIWKLNLASEIDGYDGSKFLKNYTFAGFSGSSDEKRSHGKTNSVFMKHSNFSPHRGGSGTNFAHSSMYKNGTKPRDRDDDGKPIAFGGNSLDSSLSNGAFIANYVRPNPNPYGGLTKSALEQSIFIDTGHFQPINNDTFSVPSNFVFNEIEVFGGDCYLDYHGFMRLYPHYEGEDEDWADYSHGVFFPWEYEINHSMRQAKGLGGTGKSLMWPNVGTKPSDDLDGTGTNGAWIDGLFSSPNVFTEAYEEFNLNPVLGFEEINIFYQPKPLNFKDNSHYPVRWRYTREKFYGDPVDTWRLFQVNDFKDLNGTYGEITSSLYIFNQIYSWQIGAFGRLRASDRALIESQQGGTLSTGIGDKLDGVDYVSSEYGNQHQWGLFKSDSAAYWVDVNKRKLIRFAQDGKVPLSDLKGQHQFLEYELPLFEDYDIPVKGRGIHGVFDYGNNDAIFTFVRDRRLSANNRQDDIVLRSRTGSGKAYVRGVVDENQTARIFWEYGTNNGQGVVLPIGKTDLGVNENGLLYLIIDEYDVDVYTYDNVNKTLLFTAKAGSYYRVYRYSKDDTWKYEEVSSEVVTPENCSLTFNEYLNAFTSYHSYQPSLYINTKFLVLSNYSNSGYTDKNNVHVHDMGLKADFPSFSRKSVLSISSNEAPMVSKTFDSLRVNCNYDFDIALSNFIMETESQYQYIDIANDSRRKYLENVLRFPLRTKIQKDRMRGKHILMTFELTNNQSLNDRITNLVTHYRASNRL